MPTEIPITYIIYIIIGYFIILFIAIITTAIYSNKIYKEVKMLNVLANQNLQESKKQKKLAKISAQQIIDEVTPEFINEEEKREKVAPVETREQDLLKDVAQKIEPEVPIKVQGGNQ